MAKKYSTSYNLIEGDTEYDYVYIPNKLSQTIDIKSVVPGSVEKIGIETGGIIISMLEMVLVFDNDDTSGRGLVAKVSVIEGKAIDTISVATSSISGVEVYPSDYSMELIFLFQTTLITYTEFRWYCCIWIINHFIYRLKVFYNSWSNY
jgi:hypothetical protein